MASTNGGPETRIVIEADTPVLCDSWDAWFEEYKALFSIVLEVWKDS